MEQSYASLLDFVRPLDLLCEKSHATIELPDELELQAIWFNGQFGRDFTTTCGKKIYIKQFGFWNRSAGPDFLHAAISIDGETYAGPLEIDTRPSDWENHGHDVNPAFNETIVHVVFEPSLTDHYTRTVDHCEVPKVVVPLSRIQAALQAPLSASAPLHMGRCHKPLANTSVLRINDLLEQAAKHRCLVKAKRLMAIRESHGKDQSLWVAVAETLGYRPNRLPMTLLAQRLPIQQLKSYGDRSLALCFGTAGFLHPDIHKKAPEDSQQWLENLWETWWQDRTKYQLDQDREIKWVLHGNRPINHPQRRLATLSVISQHWPTFRKLSTQPKALTDWLRSLTDPFWSKHYTLTSKPAAKKLVLIGKDRISDLIINHLLPLKIAEGDKTAWATYQSFPAPAINEKVRRAHYRLFGNREDAAQFLKKSWHHQALLQIYQDFCLADTSDCDDCPFPEQLSHF
ncbi:MAG: DUF2851 family protein [Akkermansiaceae bacterium]